jgi:hypothetical protein
MIRHSGSPKSAAVAVRPPSGVDRVRPLRWPGLGSYPADCAIQPFRATCPLLGEHRGRLSATDPNMIGEASDDK